MEYIEIAVGDISFRNKVIPIYSLNDYLVKGKELYRSYFSFDEVVAKEIEEAHKNNLENVKFTGNFSLPIIVLDIDRGQSTFSSVTQKAANFVNRLFKEYNLENNLQIWFSGRGYHIHIPDIFGFEPSSDLPFIVKRTIETHFPEADLMPIHNRGMIRVSYSLNKKSGLYKVPINVNDIWFMTEDKILKDASEPKKKKLQKLTVPEKKFKIIKLSKKDKSKPISIFKPTKIVTCMQNCYNTGEVEGTRHVRTLALSKWLRNIGLPSTATYSVLKDYAGSLPSYEIKRIVDSTYENNYRPHCDNEIYKEFCDPICIFHKKKNYMADVVSAEDQEQNYNEYIKSDWKKVSINLADILPMSVKEWWIEPETLVGLIGATGLNKTALAQNIAVKLNGFDPILYISTEFSNNLLFRRFIQICYDYTKSDVIKYYMKNSNSLSKKINHINYLYDIPDYENLERLIKKLNPKILIIDTIDDIIHEKKKGLEGEDAVSRGLKQLCMKYKIITIAVHHISKSAAYDDKGIPKHLNVVSGRGSGVFEHKCDILLGIEGIQTEPYRRLRSLKGRDNFPIAEDYKIDMNTFVFKKGE